MFDPTIVISAAALMGLAIVSAALLRAWHGWLALKERELSGQISPRRDDDGSALGAARIELSDMKERIRKLEAIASGVEL